VKSVKSRLRQILADEGILPRTAAFRKGDTVSYKGKTYRLQYSGPTRYGDRAKLQFLDGSKEFWVDLSLVSPSSGGGKTTYSPRSRGRCRGCGGPVVDAPHHRAMDGYCGSCAFDEFDM